MTEHDTNTRKTLTVARSPFRRCKKLKRESESWSQFLHRAADALQAEDSGGEHDTNTLTEEHIEEIARMSGKYAADELEARL